MSYLPTSQAFLEQSSLLLDAYPDSTRITTKYTFPSRRRQQKRQQRQQQQQKQEQQEQQTETAPAANEPPTQQNQPPLATLTLKTFTPSAGICLKYHTNKAAEVGRLVTGLGLLAARKDVASLGGAPAAATGAGTGDVEMSDAAAAAGEEQGPPTAAGGAQASGKGGGKSKKKGGGGGGGGGGGKGRR